MGRVLNRGTKHRPRYSIRWYDEHGKRQHRATGQTLKAAAEAMLADIEAKVRAAKLGISAPAAPASAPPTASPSAPVETAPALALTVRQLGEKFLAEYSSPRIKSIDVYRRQARSTLKCRIYPTLADRPAPSLRPLDVERLRDAQLAAGLKPGSVAQTLATLSRMYTWGRRAGLVECVNPVADVERTHSAEALDYLAREEVAKLLAHTQEHAPAVYPMTATAIYCGLRKGELFGLRWIDVHLDAARLDVNRSYRGLPKSGKPRHLPMHPDLVRILRAWQERCPRVDGLVFPVEAAPARFRIGSKEDMLDLPAILVAAECHAPAKPWHSLRHTFAAHAAMSGIPIYTLQKLMGHATIAMTQRYAHLAPDYLAAEVARLDFGQVDQSRRKLRVA